MIRAIRALETPIIHAGLHPSLGANINGPSLIRRPDWAPGPGRYMLYFAHHMGRHIRLAFADHLTGPWEVHGPGVLPLSSTPLAQVPPDLPQPEWASDLGVDGLYHHLASPDVRVDHLTQRFEMWFHGLANDGEQVTYPALSPDGLDWRVTGPPTDDNYLRVFDVAGATYAMAREGRLLRLEGDRFHPGPLPIPRPVRHVAVLVRVDRLHVAYSCIGDAPERILHTALDLSRPWPDWPQCAPETELLRPVRQWEGAQEPIRPSFVGAVGFCHELRDPAFFEDEGQVWLLYSGAGEAALGVARVEGI